MHNISVHNFFECPSYIYKQQTVQLCQHMKTVKMQVLDESFYHFTSLLKWSEDLVYIWKMMLVLTPS